MGLNWAKIKVLARLHFFWGALGENMLLWASHMALIVKNLSSNAGGIKDVGSIPGSGKSPGGEHDNPLQCYCLENPMDRGAWCAIVHGVAKSRTLLRS